MKTIGILSQNESQKDALDIPPIIVFIRHNGGVPQENCLKNASNRAHLSSHHLAIHQQSFGLLDTNCAKKH